jgi:AAA family ATPase
MSLENIELRGCKHSFSIESLESTEDSFSNSRPISIGRFIPGKTRIRIITSGTNGSATERVPHLVLHDPSLGGLDQQIQFLNRIFKAYDCPRPSNSYLLDPAGLLLYGPSGTGKSLLLRAIAKIGWGPAYTIESASCRRSFAEGALIIRKEFQKAKSVPKSIILVDQLDILAPNRSSEGFSELANVLGSELAAANQAPNRILVVATATRLSDVEQSLRRSERFDHEIEIPVPESKARAAILKTLLFSPDTPNQLLDEIAERTHGYVGADLNELVQKAGHEAEQRASSSTEVEDIEARPHQIRNLDQTDSIGSTPRPTKADFEVALSKTAPTAMREIFLEAPNVRWTDIGGQERVKQALREGVIWQFKVCSRASCFIC